MSEWWDTPFLLFIALSMVILVLRPPLPALEKVCAFFGIGGLDASVAEALWFGSAGLLGLLFNNAATNVWGADYGAGQLALGLGSATGLGLAITWLASVVQAQDATAPASPPPEPGPGEKL